MIALDIESSGLDLAKCGIWQIGAVEIENPKNYFFEEAKIDDEDMIMEGALKLTEKTEAELRDKNKQSQKQLILNFIEWAKTCETKIPVGQNPGWDIFFILNKCLKYGTYEKAIRIIGFKTIDLHTIAQMKYLKENGGYSLRDTGTSSMGLPSILKFCGIEDARRKVEGTKIVSKGGAHNALEDAKLTAKCYEVLLK